MFITFMLGMMVESVGDMSVQEKYTWSLPVTGFIIMSGFFALGYFSGKKDFEN